MNPYEVIEKIDESFKRLTGNCLYAHQKEAMRFVIDGIQEHGSSGGIISMPTGAGKTRFATALLVALYSCNLLIEGHVVLFLTPRKIIKEQAGEELQKLYRFHKDIQRNKIKSYGYSLTIGLSDLDSSPFYIQEIEDSDTLNTCLYGIQNKVSIYISTPQLLKSFVQQYGYERFSKVDGIFFDEIHHTFVGPSIGPAISKLKMSSNLRFTLGLSATPTWDSYRLTGPVLYSFSSSKAMRAGIITKSLKIIRTNTNVKLENEYKGKEWQYAVKDRAELYAKETINRLEKESINGRLPKALIVTTNTTEADELVQQLHQIWHKQLVFKAHYRGTNVSNAISKFKKNKEGILVTVNMADIGFDDTELEALVIAKQINTPIGYIQLRGRVLRKAKEEDNLKQKKYALILDFTQSSSYEACVLDIEKGNERLIRRIESREIRKDLEGTNKAVKLVRGEVTLEEFEEILVTPDKEPQPLEPIEVSQTNTIPKTFTSPITPKTFTSPITVSYGQSFLLKCYTVSDAARIPDIIKRKEEEFNVPIWHVNIQYHANDLPLIYQAFKEFKPAQGPEQNKSSNEKHIYLISPGEDLHFLHVRLVET
jgi:superfamily II DNA or RNA helicase